MTKAYEQAEDSPPPLLVAITGGIAEVTLNRPDRGNSISPAMMKALEETWGKLEPDRDVRVVLLTAAGERHFCTGADVSALEVGVGGLNNQPYAVANRFTPRMMHMTKPVICAVNGLVNGGGLHFVADCDIVVASETATFMDSHVSVGQVSGLESQGIARRAGLGAALLMGLAGRSYRMDAQRAWMLGMVDLLEPTPAAALAKARELAATIGENSPQAMALSKRAIWATTELSDPVAADYGWELLKSHWAHPDFTEGPKAFGEKRKPVWNPDPNAR